MLIQEYKNRKLIELQNNELIELEERLRSATSKEDILKVLEEIINNFSTFHCQPGREMISKLLRAKEAPLKNKDFIISEIQIFLFHSQFL